MSKKKKPQQFQLPWFKCYQDAWLDGTRELTPDQRGIYFDCLCLMYKYDAPLRGDDTWVAHQLHVKLRVWKKVRKELVACGKLVETDAGLINERAVQEVVERSSMRSRRALAASSRESERRLEPEFPFENNKRVPTNAPQKVLHARASSDHQSEDTEKKKEADVNLDASHEDEERRRTPVIPKHMREELAESVGQGRADELMQEYLQSDMAANAKVISSAFRGWLKKIHGIVISRPGSNVFHLGDAVEMLPKDKYGRPDATLPKVVTKNVRWRG